MPNTTAREQLLATLPPELHPLLAPIPGGAPAGTAPAGDPSFVSLQDEIHKLGGMSTAAVRWPLVREHATSVLTLRDALTDMAR